VAVRAVEAVGAGVQEGHLEWASVEEFLREALGDDDPEVARTAVEAVGAGVQEGHLEWAAVEGFLTDNYIEHERRTRRSILETAASIGNHDLLLDPGTDLLRSIPREPNPGLRELATAEVIGPCLDHADGREQFLLELLEDIVNDDDSRIQLRGIDLVSRGLSQLDTDGEWRALLVDVATDESRGSDLRGSALDSLVETTDASAVDETLLAVLGSVTKAESESLHARALASVGVVLTQAGTHLDPEQLQHLHDLLGRGLVDQADEVRHAAARTVAGVHRDGSPLSLDGQVDDLRRLLGTMAFSPADKVELVDIVSHGAEPVQFRSSASRADDQV
jgi:HEAT repeat protein